MTDRVEITEAMITAAMETGKRTGALVSTARYVDVRRMLSAAIAEMAFESFGPRYDLVVATGIDRKKARFVSATEQRGYFRVECEDGKPLVVHGNDIYSGGRPREIK